jgi:transcriptional regulator with XRE-family HTH domain
LSKDTAATGDRWAVSEAVRERMAQRGLSTAEIARRSGLSETTIRDITYGTNRHNKSTLVAISAVLGWPPDYLTNILRGEPGKNVTPVSQLEAHLARLAEGIGALREDVAGLKDVVHEIDEKIEVIYKARRSPGDA